MSTLARPVGGERSSCARRGRGAGSSRSRVQADKVKYSRLQRRRRVNGVVGLKPILAHDRRHLRDHVAERHARVADRRQQLTPSGTPSPEQARRERTNPVINSDIFDSLPRMALPKRGDDSTWLSSTSRRSLKTTPELESRTCASTRTRSSCDGLSERSASATTSVSSTNMVGGTQESKSKARTPPSRGGRPRDAGTYSMSTESTRGGPRGTAS